MKVFEETFGIDKLQRRVAKLASSIESQFYDPINGRFLLTNSDLRRMIQDVEEFKVRHATISQDINETYKIGNRLLTYLEKQIIIDYLLRGELEKMEANFPHLKEQALNFLGHEMYYDLAVLQSTEGQRRKELYVPLGPLDPYFKVLME